MATTTHDQLHAEIFGEPGGNLIDLKENFCFRVDASMQIGTGHFMRCLTLARELKSRGARILFVCRHLPAHLRGLLVSDGIECVVFPAASGDSGVDELAHSRWLGVAQAQDAQETIEALSRESWRWMIVDHYALDHRWEKLMRVSCEKILVIDDLADRRHDCDILLDQNYYYDMATRYSGKVSGDCLVLLGPAYALLRKEFSLLRERATPREGKVKRVLIFFGGVDANNHTATAMHVLAEIGIRGLVVDVIVGAQHPHLQEIERLCGQYNFHCHIQTDRIAELMAVADLAVGAGGSATWERCCLGLPTLAICTAVNQEQQLADAASAGLLIAPDLAEESGPALVLHLRALLQNNHLRRFVSRNSMQLVDARGISRIVSSIGFTGLDVRIVSLSDSLQLFKWRNHPSIRAVSRNPAEIPFEEHQSWLAQVVSDRQRILLIGERDGFPIGVVRFDQCKAVAEVSIYLVPDSSSPGEGIELMSASEQWIKRNRPEIKSVQASVLGANARSHRLFVRSGYRVEYTKFMKSLD